MQIKFLLVSWLLLSCLLCNAPAAAGDGRFVVEYGNSDQYGELRQAFKEARLLEEIADYLNQAVILPDNVTIALEQCGTINAFYNPGNQRISMCYELIEYFVQVFTQNQEQEGDNIGDAEADPEDAAIDATIFVFFHELGHALTHVLDIPITGKEEDAVDQLSTWILADGSDEGELAALHGAMSFYLETSAGEETSVDDLAFWDEHSLSQQRFYNIMCWVYGQNQEKYEYLVSDEYLPADRAERCADEWTQMDSSWERLLAEHLNESLK
jgi:hypothetical protein